MNALEKRTQGPSIMKRIIFEVIEFQIPLCYVPSDKLLSAAGKIFRGWRDRHVPLEERPCDSTSLVYQACGNTQA
jgi:hypothetical protein